MELFEEVYSLEKVPTMPLAQDRVDRPHGRHLVAMKRAAPLNLESQKT